ncbi:hypothetical protein L7F22_057417 [Adiantum nelumboides]|nr:hypothetical protein [Adiantum nelumboides]
MEYLSPDDWKSVHQWCNNQLPKIDQSRMWLAVNSALQRAFNLECGMEYLSADDWKSVQQLCRSVSKHDESALLLAVENAAKTVLKLKHEVAHGDMRPPNVMARAVEAGFEIKFVDFDWAGVASHTFYPSFINIEQDWHEGVGSGMPLSQDHDKWWWSQESGCNIRFQLHSLSAS